MTDEEEEALISQAINMERVLTFWQALMLVSPATGHMEHTDLSEPPGEPSAIPQLEALRLLRAREVDGMTEMELTEEGHAVARWFGTVMMETCGLDLRLLG